MLELRDLRRAFGDRTALDGLSFDVPPGVLFGFVGRNGAGKTTAMRIVCGLLEADGGAVLWGGRPIDGAMRACIGYMPEERGLYPRMHVRDHLDYLAELHGLARAEAQAATSAWLARLGIADRADDRVEALSLGNQQRVQLAAALVHSPALLVLDEPFSGLDPIGADLVAEVLRERAAEGVAVVFSSHQLEVVERLCTHVAIIEAGRVVATGTVEDLRREASAARRTRIRVEVAGAAPGWVPSVPGSRVVADDRDGILIELSDGATADDVLDAARAGGHVVAFGVVRPSLADLFREAVTQS